MNLDHDPGEQDALVKAVARQPWHAPVIEVIEARTAEFGVPGFRGGQDAFSFS